jgi:hypothetical protein
MYEELKNNDMYEGPDINRAEIRAKYIKDLTNHRKLYEGLIKSYSINDTIGRLSLANNKNKLQVKYRFEESQDNRALPYIIITFKKYFKENVNKIINIFNMCGWYLASFKDINNNLYKNKYELIDVDNYGELSEMTFRAKFDVEVEKNKYPEYLYHITPEIFVKKIEYIGLKPKSLNKLIGHEDAIYLFNLRSDDELMDLVKQLDAKRVKNENGPKSNTYILFKVQVPRHDLFKLFIDPDLFNGYFTKNNIHPNYLKIVKEIKL